ncbi:MAG: outer membrane lipoprotein-sorting protein [Arcobacter sp.]|nr:MAG: outer membrane lipoprotein-sorting protein [Arcobacter sp.]
MKKLLILVLMKLSLMAGMSVDEIVDSVDKRDLGDNSISTLQMVLIDKNKKQRVRTLKTYSKYFGEDIYNLIYFLTPSDVRQTAFLTYDYDKSSKDDDQWLYLPALKLSKRIASSDKSASFMGSDFSYSDMTSRNPEDYNYKITKESKVNGQKVWIIESTPKTQKTIDETGYTKSYLFVRQDNFVVVRAMHLLLDGKKKYLDVKELKQIDGIWVATKTQMTTKKLKQTLHTTILQLSDVKFNQNLDDNFFTVRQIEKGI